MSHEPIPHGGAGEPPNPTPTPADPAQVEALKEEVSRLRDQLAKATAEATEYRRAAYAMLNELVPYVPPTDEELHDMMYGPRGPSLLSVIEEYERRLSE